MAASSRVDNSIEAIGRRVRDLRLQVGATQSQIAPSDMTSNSVSDLENGRHVPTRRQLEELADLLGCSAIYLSHGISEEEYEQLHIELTAARDSVYEGRFTQAVEGFTGVIDSTLVDFFPEMKNDALYGRAEAWEGAGEYERAAAEFRALAGRASPTDRWWGDAAAATVRCLHHAGDPGGALAFGRRSIEEVGRWRQRPGAWGTAGLKVAAEMLPVYVAMGDQKAALKLMGRLQDRMGAGHSADLRFAVHLNMARAHVAFGNIEMLYAETNAAFRIAEQERLGSPPMLVNSYAHFLLESGHPGPARVALDTLEQEERRGRTALPGVAEARQALMDRARSVLYEGEGRDAAAVVAHAFSAGVRERMNVRPTREGTPNPGQRQAATDRSADQSGDLGRG